MPEQMVEAQRSANLAGQNPAIDDLARNQVFKRWDALKRLRGPLEPDMEDCSRAYDLIKVKQYYHGRSDLTLPTIANLVERLVPRVVRATVGRDDFFDAVPERSADQEKALVNKELLKSQLERDAFRRKYPAVVRDAAIYGTGIWKARWKYEVRADTGAVLFDGPSGDSLDWRNVWQDPRAADFTKTDVVEKMALSLTEVRRLVRLGVFETVAAEAALASNSGARTVGESRVRLSRGHLDEGLEPGFWEYVEFWGEFPLDATDSLTADKTETVPCVIGILGGKHVVRLERNPFNCQRNPYFKMVLLERTGEFYGISLVKKALNLWIEQNDGRNQANDARSFAVCPVMFKPPTSGPDKKVSQRIFPGAVITAPPGTSFAAFPDVTTPMMKWEPVMRRDMEETMGAPSLLDSQPMADSATEASIQHSEAAVRIGAYAYVVEDVFLVPLLAFYHELNKQYLTTETAVRIKGFQGYDFRPVTPKDIAGNFTFITVGASTMVRGAALTAQFLQTTDRMMLVEQVQPGTFDMIRWWETFFREALEIPHPDLYIKGLKLRGRVPTVEEVHGMLLEGQRVEPDPRQNFAETLPQYGAFIAQRKEVLASEPDIMKLFIAHLYDAEAVAREVLLAKQAMMAETMAAAAPAGGKPGAPGSSGGKSNKKVDDSDRDGKGLGTPRQSMKSASQGTAGRSKQ